MQSKTNNHTIQNKYTIITNTNSTNKFNKQKTKTQYSSNFHTLKHFNNNITTHTQP